MPATTTANSAAPPARTGTRDSTRESDDGRRRQQTRASSDRRRSRAREIDRPRHRHRRDGGRDRSISRARLRRRSEEARVCWRRRPSSLSLVLSRVPVLAGGAAEFAVVVAGMVAIVIVYLIAFSARVVSRLRIVRLAQCALGRLAAAKRLGDQRIGQY